MGAPVFRWASSLTALFMLTIGAIRARPYEDNGLRSFLMPAADCPAAACWHGILPGLTTIQQAVLLIRRHPWIDQAPTLIWFSTPAVSSFSWPWNGRQPGFIDHDRLGSMIARRNVVEILRVPTTVTLGDLQLASAAPIKIPAGVCGDYTVDYPDYGFYIRLEILCPFRSASFWRSRVVLYYVKPANQDSER